MPWAQGSLKFWLKLPESPSSLFVGAMALQQMGVATDIVNLAFGLLLGAIAVAIAIAFGLGDAM
jgi:hypothetical protein